MWYRNVRICYVCIYICIYILMCIYVCIYHDEPAYPTATSERPLSWSLPPDSDGEATKIQPVCTQIHVYQKLIIIMKTVIK